MTDFFAFSFRRLLLFSFSFLSLPISFSSCYLLPVCTIISAHEQQLDQLRPLQRIEIKIHRAEQMAHKRSSAESPISRGHVAGVSGRR